MSTRVYTSYIDEDGVEWEVRGTFSPGELRGACAAYYIDPPEGPVVEDEEARLEDGSTAWLPLDDIFTEQEAERIRERLATNGMEGR